MHGYESDRVSIADAPSHEVLKELMTQHGLSQSDLPEIGSQGVVSEILRGKRVLNVCHIKLLAERARQDRYAIQKYYTDRNGNTDYSKELTRHFYDAIRAASKHERIGKVAHRAGVRCLNVLDYSIFYFSNEKSVP